MGMTFAGRQVLDAAFVLDTCRSHEFPTDWLDKANRYENPLGVRSGCGHVLMYRGDLDYLNQAGTLNAENDLVISDTTSTRTLKNLHAVSTRCLTPGYPNDPAAIHLVELADVRRIARLNAYMTFGNNSPSRWAYNLRQTPNGNFHPFTLNPATGAAWTWADLWADAWGKVFGAFAYGARLARHATAPVLPAVPDGTPDGLDFHGWRGTDVLAYLLARLGLALALDVFADAFALVQPGATQPGLAAAEANNLATGRLHDDEPVGLWLGTVPRAVSVVFRKQGAREGDYGDTPWVIVGVDGVTSLGVPADQAYGLEVLFDELPAAMRSDNGGGDTCDNSAALSSRALARAAEFYRIRRGFQNKPYRKAYTGFLADFRPGEEVRSVAWQDLAGGDHGGGPLTIVDRTPCSPDPWADWPAGEAGSGSGRPWHLGPPEQPWRRVALLGGGAPGAGIPAGYDDYGLIQWDTAGDLSVDMTQVGNPNGAGPPFLAYRPQAAAGIEIGLLVGFKNDRPAYVTVGPVPVAFWTPTGTAILPLASNTYADVLTAQVGGVYLITGALMLTTLGTDWSVQPLVGSAGTGAFLTAGLGPTGPVFTGSQSATATVCVPVSVVVTVSVAPCKFSFKVSNGGAVNGLSVLSGGNFALVKL